MAPTHGRCALVSVTGHHHRQLLSGDHLHHGLLGTTWSGPENKNSSYFCYDAPIYSMAPGKVIEMLDGIPENVPHSGKIAIDVNFFQCRR